MKDLGGGVDDAEADRDQGIATAEDDPRDQQLCDQLGVYHVRSVLTPTTFRILHPPSPGTCSHPKPPPRGYPARRSQERGLNSLLPSERGEGVGMRGVLRR